MGALDRDGLFKSVSSGEMVFSSKDRCDSDSGWPAFTKPLDSSSVLKPEDSHFNSEDGHNVTSITDYEYRCRISNNGPKETGGLIYSVNPASLTFVPKEELSAQEAKLYGFEPLNFYELPAVDAKGDKIPSLSTICKDAKATLVVNVASQ